MKTDKEGKGKGRGRGRRDEETRYRERKLIENGRKEKNISALMKRKRGK